MKKWLDGLYKKSELYFALTWIGLYCALNSLANPVSEMLGIDSIAALICNALLSTVLFIWIRQSGRMQDYGLCRSSVPARRFLWYIPLAVFASGNLWFGFAANLPPAGALCYILNMCFVGFLEEVIFRGLLFRALAKDGIRMAIVVSSVTFGLGHILNLFNGSGMNLAANICQVAGAVACGFLFVILFHRGGSLLPCIIAHAVNNAVSVFANEGGLTVGKQLLFSAVHMLIVISYTLILCRTLPGRGESDL